MDSDGRPEPFGGEATHRTMAKACALVGLDASAARLMRLGENALYALPSERIVVRVARSTDMLVDVQKEVDVARWLRDVDYPAVRLADVADAPLVVDGHPVTFWCLIEVTEPKPSPADLGRLLLRLHNLEVPEWLRLPDFEPFARVDQRLANAPVSVAADDLAFLRRLLDELRGAYNTLSFEFPPGPVHGDAHRGNLLRDATGEVLLIDFEQFCHGPREWDLSLAAMYRYALDWFTEDEYRTLAGSYGYDVASWPGAPTLRGIRELGMTTWLMQMVEHDTAKSVEFRHRVDDIRSGRFPRQWQPF